MRIEVKRLPVLIAAGLSLALSPRDGKAQQPPASTVQRALADPGMASLIRARVAQSGLSPEQIRARLQAAGYAPTLLDNYLSPSDTTTALPGNDVLSAVRFLGLVDAADQSKPGSSQAVPAPAPQSQQADSARSRIFGLDVFRRSTSQFEADLAGPVDASYKLGPRDVLALILTGTINASYTLELTREGFVVIPQVGQIYLANLTLGQASDIVFRRLQQVYSNIGRSSSAATQFYLTVAKLRTNQVFVVGDANAPGSYLVSSAGTMLSALYAAGGPSDNGSLRGVELRRNGQVVSRLDIYDYLIAGDASRDARMESGDILFVPVHGPRVEIAGEVVRPAIYELKTGETIADLIRMAGGFTAQAGRNRVLVQRILPPASRTPGGRDRTVLDITSDAFLSGVGPSIPLEPGDRVEVFPVADRVRNEIEVAGAVWAPGKQGFMPGMKLSDALRRAGGVRPDIKDVLVSRLRSDQSREQLRAAVLDTLGALAQDILLQEDDLITAYGTSNFRPDRYVVITGAVNGGGRFPWRTGMTLRDLVHLAGGLSDGAYLAKAELARLPEDRRNGELSEAITVPLDSTYLLERGLDGSYAGPPGLSVAAGRAPEVPLRPYDNVLIFRQPGWQLDRTVTLLGEVKFPGNYTLEFKEERISDVVKRAGGLTPYAYPMGARFTRPNAAVGRVGVDLDEALRKPKSRGDFVLLDGDTLVIPPFRPTVQVEGAVHSPLAVAYVPGRSLSYYVQAAGGFAFNADKERSFVRQPTGIVDPYEKRWWVIPDSDPEVHAGAVVVVPTKDPNARKDWTAIAGSVAQVLASVTAIIILAVRAK